MILDTFGSDFNGLVEAITQFLRVIVLFQAGISAVTMAALYSPLERNDTHQISVVIKSSQSFLKKVVLVFVIFSICLAIGYPLLVKDEFDFIYTASLVLIMCLSTVVQFFFGQVYQFLFTADQNHRLISMVNSAKVLVSTVISVILIQSGFGMRAVKLGAAIVFVIAPLFIYLYAQRKYKLQKSVEVDLAVIDQRWAHFGAQFASFVSMNSGLIILSAFVNLYEISVFAIYNLVMSGIFGFFLPLTRGIDAAFGNMIAKNEHSLLKKNLRVYEQIVFGATAFLFSITAVMTLPFVMLYTQNVFDVEYYRPALMAVIVAATAFRCLYFPYMSVTNAAGHFRPLRKYAFLEATLTIAISIAMIQWIGITGAAVGMLFSYSFRTGYYAVYGSKVIVNRSVWVFAKRLFVTMACVATIIALSSLLPLPTELSFLQWAMNALVLSVMALAVVGLFEYLFFKDDLHETIAMACRLVRKS
ncbi:MAG: polysaccharide biosynthesis C-terminal domain-containing protein [Propionibacteriaceae bacterium]|nr:polysaccharide biosynthesis C-terminal domain-containing protein [Propionibacteriaceae bacterium]